MDEAYKLIRAVCTAFSLRTIHVTVVLCV